MEQIVILHQISSNLECSAIHPFQTLTLTKNSVLESSHCNDMNSVTDIYSEPVNNMMKH